MIQIFPGLLAGYRLALLQELVEDVVSNSLWQIFFRGQPFEGLLRLVQSLFSFELFQNVYWDVAVVDMLRRGVNSRVVVLMSIEFSGVLIRLQDVLSNGVLGVLELLLDGF